MEMPRILFGTGVSATKDYVGMKSVVNVALSHGIGGFDTAPSYQSEELLGNVLNETLNELGLKREQIFVQTKIDPWQMQLGAQSVCEFAKEALKKMKLDYFDSLLIHWPIPEYILETWNELLSLKSEGITHNIGVCNVRKRQLEFYTSMGINPDVVQIERNPLNTCLEEIDFCKKNQLAIQAYSPLCKMNPKIRDNSLLDELSKKYNKSIGQIVIRYHIDGGVAPVFTSKKPERVAEYSSVFDFELSKSEISQIDALNENYKLYLESWSCPGF